MPRPGRFRRRFDRLSLPRPKLPRPRLPWRRRSRPTPPVPPIPPPAKPPPKPSRGLWFRLVTRLRAIRYWIREKARIGWGAFRRPVDGLAYWWSKRSPSTRRRIYAIAGVVVLYLIVKFISVPGVPCQISEAKECAPSNDTIAFVPANALLYAHLTVNSDSHQAELADDLPDEFPGFVAIAQEATSAQPSASGKPIDIANAVLPWAKDDVALITIPGPKKTTVSAYVAGVGDDGKADQFITSIAPPGAPQKTEQDGSPLSVYPGGFATALSGDQLLFGGDAAVRAALSAESGKLPDLDGADQDAARETLPDVRIAEIYLSKAGVKRYLAGRTGAATQLDTFVDYGATTGMAASATLKDDGIGIDLASTLDPNREQQSPTVFADLPEFDPGLADEAGTRAIGYVGVGELGPALNRVLATAGPGGQGLAGALRTLAQSLKQKAGVDPLEDLLPALAGQAALVAEPTEGSPYASLIVDDVDEKKATAALARLQRPLLTALGTGGPQVPAFQSEEVDGVAVNSVQISATVDLSYAVFDGKLVISTQPAGIEQARDGGDDLAGTEGFEKATDGLPDSVSALVFLNLEELLGLPPLKESFAVNPLYASLSEDISRIGSLGIAVRGSEEKLRSDVFLAIDD